MTEQKSHRFTARYDLSQNILEGALIHALRRSLFGLSTVILKKRGKERIFNFFPQRINVKKRG